MTYAEIKEKVEKFGPNLPISAENENAEYVIIGEGYACGQHFYELCSMQNNNWVRINTYWEDGTIEETYER